MEIINIRKTRRKHKYLEDLAGLMCELWNDDDLEGFYLGMKKALKNKNYTVLMAYENNRAVGYIELCTNSCYEETMSQFPILNICGLYVSATMRHFGIASALIKEAENYGREEHCTRIASDYFDYNTPSALLHEKMGFHITSKKISVIKDIPDSII